jgi:Flp pilus assembly protein TadB
MRGALITVKCDCGRLRYLQYGERWDCECGRSWNTQQIPADEYWGIMHEARRQRLLMIGAAVVVALVFLALALVFKIRVMALAPVILAGWFLILMPRWRRKLREQARSLRRWKLSPE